MTTVVLAHWQHAVLLPHCIIMVSAETMQDVQLYLTTTEFTERDPIHVELVHVQRSLDMLKNMDAEIDSDAESWIMMHVHSVPGMPDGASSSCKAPKDVMMMYGSQDRAEVWRERQQGISYVTPALMN